MRPAGQVRVAVAVAVQNTLSTPYLFSFITLKIITNFDEVQSHAFDLTLIPSLNTVNPRKRPALE